MKDSDAWRKPARSLAGYLVAPLTNGGWLDNIDTLHVIPHGTLNYLPFSVLLDDVNGKERFLIEHYDIHSTRPGAHSTPRGASIPGNEKLRGMLRPGRALVEYVVADDRILIFVLTSKFIKAVSISARRRDINAKVELLRELLLMKDSDAWRKPARSLAGYLVAPLTNGGWLDNIDTLHVIPHGTLNYLPFSVLLDDVNGKERFLIEHYDISYLPSAVVLNNNGVAKKPAKQCKG